MQAVRERRGRSTGGLLGKPLHNLRLRAVSPDGDVRTLRVKSRKYTIGASEECSLKLRGTRLHPVHCLIVRGTRGTIVRNLSSGNKLNGEEFTDAQLDPGDRLRLGTFEFVVLPHRRRRRRKRFDSLAAHGPESGATLQLTVAIESRMNRLEEQLVGLQRQQTRNKIRKLRRTIDRLSDQIENQQVRHSLERRQWDTERDSLLADVELQRDCSDAYFEPPTASISDHQTEAIEEELSVLSTQLSNAQLQHQAKQDQWLAERSQLEKQLQETRTRIAALEHELAAFEAKAAGFAAERASYESKTGELTLSLEQLSARLEEQQSAHQAEGEAWRTARIEIETELQTTRLDLQETTQRLARVEGELTSQRSASDAAAVAFQQQRADLQEEQRQLTAQLETSENAVRDSQAQVEQWERECTALATRAEELEQHIVALQQATLDSAEISDSVEEAVSLRRELAVWKGHQNEWQQEKQRLTDQLDTVQSDFANEQQRNHDLEKQTAARNAEWATARDELQAALEVASSKPSPQVADSHLRELEGQLSELREQIDYWKQRAAQPENLIEDGGAAEADSAEQDEDLETSAEFEPANDPDQTVWEGQTLALRQGANPAEVGANTELPGAPVDTASVIARLAQSTPTDESSTESAPFDDTAEPPIQADPLQETIEEPVQTSPVEPTIEAAAEPADAELKQNRGETAATVGDEDAIEDYMNRLLARVRGDETPPAGAEPTSDRTPITEVEIDHELLVEEEEQPEAGEFIPRRTAPEGTDSLAAMRSLANDSARSAIASHAKRNWMEVAKYQICGAALGITGAIVAFVTLESRPIVAAFGVMVGLLIAAGFAGQTLGVRRQLLLGSDTGNNEEGSEGYAPEMPADDHTEEPHVAERDV